VPETGRYRITARGAQGGDTNVTELGGNGALVSAVFPFDGGDQLTMVVGQRGESKDECSDYGAGGGGGTYVTLVSDEGETITPLDVRVVPLVIAAGGGGAGDEDSGCEGQNSRFYDGRWRTVGDGLGGESPLEGGGGGGGFLGDGEGGDAASGLAFVNGASGANESYPGGFGGGGAPYDSGGGGGGFTGGGTSAFDARGGYSFNAGSSPTGADGENAGAGSVTIERLPE
jgi:hypothetical protein